MMVRLPLLVPTICVLFSGATGVMAQAAHSDITLTAKVRDFKEISPSDTAGAHPHFNNNNGCSAQELGIHSVQAELDSTGPADGGAFPGDNRTPKLMEDMPSTLSKCYSPADRFSDWFSDKAGVNRSFLVDLRFRWNAVKSAYEFEDKYFFPIDDSSTFTRVDTAVGPFGHLQTDSLDGVDLSTHNFGFTMELHSEFVFHAGKGQNVSIQGDDDIWLFLNGKRVVDLGGVHQVQGAEVSLDSLQGVLGLEDGKMYAFDFFFAERHVASSSCAITTNLAFGETVASALGPRPALRTAARTAAASGPVEIYDRAGRLIRSLRASDAQSAWDRKDGNGRPAAPGVYFWRAAAQSGDAARRASGLFVLR
jgi:fibro-slime domain-containing protein